MEPKRGKALIEHIRQLPEPPTDELIYLTQTTLNVGDCLVVVDALKRRFPTLTGPPSDDICYATTNRQEAVKAAAGTVEYFIVVGAPISSNSKRLVEVAREAGSPADLFQNVEELKKAEPGRFNRIGITAGASTPDVLVEEIVDYLARIGFDDLQTYHYIHEGMHFTLPYQLRQDLADKGIPV